MMFHTTWRRVARKARPISISDAGVSTPVFAGWMVASSPALSALDHARYDVWVLRCVTPEAAPEADPATSEGEGE